MAKSKFSITDRKKFKVSEESALAIVIDACEKYDIDIDANDDKKEQKRLEALLNGLVDFVRRGILELKEDGSIVQHLQNPGGTVLEVNYNKITGGQKMAMDGKDENDRYGMMYAVLGSASGLGEEAIKKLNGIDLKVAESLTIFFL